MNSSEVININPCPKCGGVNILYIEDILYEVSYLKCKNCGHSGGHIRTSYLSNHIKTFTYNCMANLWNKEKTELV